MTVRGGVPRWPSGAPIRQATYQRHSARRYVLSIDRQGTLRFSAAGTGAPTGSAFAVAVNYPRRRPAPAPFERRDHAHALAARVGWPG